MFKLELRSAVAGLWLSSKVGPDDLVTIGIIPADIVDVETWTFLLTCGSLDLQDRNNPNHAAMRGVVRTQGSTSAGTISVCETITRCVVIL